MRNKFELWSVNWTIHSHNFISQLNLFSVSAVWHYLILGRFCSEVGKTESQGGKGRSSLSRGGWGETDGASEPSYSPGKKARKEQYIWGETNGA